MPVLRLNLTNEGKSFAAALMLGVVGAEVLLILPVLVGTLVDSLGLQESEAGFVAAADNLGAAIGAVITFFLIHRASWRRLAVLALIMLAVGNLTSIWFNSFSALLPIRLFSGIGGGVAFAVAVAVIGRTSNPERAFGYLMACMVGCSTVAFLVLPSIIGPWGIDGLFTFLAVLPIGAFIVVAFVTTEMQSQQPVPVKPRSVQTVWHRAALVIVAILLYYTAQGGLYSFVVRMGISGGLSAQTVGTVLSIGAIMGAAGGGAAAWLSIRIGRTWPLAVSLFGSICSMYLFHRFSGSVNYAVALCIFSFSWNFAVPYYLGVLAHIDLTGRAVALSTAMQTGGMSLGPALAASIVDGSEYEVLLWLSVVLTLLSFCLIAPIVIPMDRRLHVDSRCHEQS